MRKMMILMLALTMCGISANAQMTKKDTGNGPFKERVSKLWDKTKKTATDVATAIGDEISNSTSGLRRIEGKYYMNVYDVNLYKGDDCATLLDLCRKQFTAKYPTVPIASCVIPQTDWETETVENAGQVAGYVQTLFCYIIGKDGNEGFINAKFVFERKKDVGKQLVNNNMKWPLWTRTDVMTNHVYDRLTSK